MASSFRKIVASSLTTDFRKACQIVSSNFSKVKDNEVLVKLCYAGVNASDVNVTAGRYGENKPPFDVGFEGVGEVVEVGGGVNSDIKAGQAVAYIHGGCFSEYMTLPVNRCLPIPAAKPEYIPLLVSGLTASISLEKYGHMKPGDKVLVTAAAGGTGHIAVQLAKNAGCHVIGICSTDEKVEFLKSLGCDHVINYKQEDFSEILKETYPKGVDLVYESVGGEVFESCVNRMAVGGRMIVLGYIDSYHSPAGIDRSRRGNTLITKMLVRSLTISGFFLMNHAPLYARHFRELARLHDAGSLKVVTENRDHLGRSLVGLDSVFDGVEFLYSRKSKGKIVVDLTGKSKL